MIRGQKRLLADKATPVIQATAKASFHNRFDIEVVDGVTGETKQIAQAENVMCTKFWAYSPFQENSYYTMNRIHIGKGAGTPAFADQSLFSLLTAYTVVTSTSNYDSVNKVFSVTLGITISESELVGETITEIGCGNPNYIFTHAMLKDMNGNPISIAKTNTDIINVYATVFLHWTDLNGFEMWDIWNPQQFVLLEHFMRLRAIGGSYEIGTAYNKVYCGDRGDPNFTTGVWSYNVALKQVTFTATRMSASACNRDGGISKLTIDHTYNCAEGFKTTLPQSWYAGSDIVGEAIGTGNGSTVDFKTAFVLTRNATIYVNGVVASGVTVENLSTYVNNIHFASPPASGAVITADYHTDAIAKDANHVFDFNFVIQLGEKTT